MKSIYKGAHILLNGRNIGNSMQNAWRLTCILASFWDITCLLSLISITGCTPVFSLSLEESTDSTMSQVGSEFVASALSRLLDDDDLSTWFK